MAIAIDEHLPPKHFPQNKINLNIRRLNKTITTKKEGIVKVITFVPSTLVLTSEDS